MEGQLNINQRPPQKQIITSAAMGAKMQGKREVSDPNQTPDAHFTLDLPLPLLRLPPISATLPLRDGMASEGPGGQKRDENQPREDQAHQQKEKKR